jgi:hypothetical protein
MNPVQARERAALARSGQRRLIPSLPARRPETYKRQALLDARILLIVTVVFTLVGCTHAASSGASPGAAALRGFGVEVEEAIAPRVPMLHLKTCGSWGCYEQDVPLSSSGPTTAMPCPSGGANSDTACGVAHVPGPGPGYGYAPVPALTFDPVTVTVRTPRGAPFPINAEVPVHPSAVCPDLPARPASARPTCPGATPQAGLRVAADGTVSQSR